MNWFIATSSNTTMDRAQKVRVEAGLHHHMSTLQLSFQSHCRQAQSPLVANVKRMKTEPTQNNASCCFPTQRIRKIQLTRICMTNTLLARKKARVIAVRDRVKMTKNSRMIALTQDMIFGKNSSEILASKLAVSAFVNRCIPVFGNEFSWRQRGRSKNAGNCKT